MKECTKCHELKHFNEFYKKTCSKDRLSSWCKRCFKEYSISNKNNILNQKKKYRENNKEKISIINSNYYSKNIAKIKDRMKLWRLVNRKKLNDYKNKPSQINLVRSRQISKKIISLRDKSCEMCGSINDLHRHHNDYGRPDQVTILCRRCHVNIHKNNIINQAF